MRAAFEPQRFFEVLGYEPGDQEYRCPDLETINIYCRGDRAQLERLASLTPLRLEGDTFVITVADFQNCTMTRGRYLDAGVILPVSCGEQKGGTYYFEFEDEHWSTATGRELWGYPKRYAKISLDVSDTAATARVWHYDTPILAADILFDHDVTPDEWKHLVFAPNIQIRAVPELDGPSYTRLDVIKRNTVANFKVKERRYGRAHVSVGAIDIGSNVLGGEPLHIVDVLGAEYVRGDFASTAQNGTPVTLAALVESEIR